MTTTMMTSLRTNIPPAVAAVFENFLTCEMTTLGRGGHPIAWPVMPITWRERGQFAVFTSIGLPQKAFNVRRDPRVALLFSDPTGSGLAAPPAVLVQGVAEAPDRIGTGLDGLEPDLQDLLRRQGLKMMERQPTTKLYMGNPLTRTLMDWYFMRLMILITPRRVSWWEHGDLSRPARRLEVGDVA